MAKKTFIGKVVSNKMAKTIVVEIERRVAHPVYKKVVKKTSRMKADTNNMEAAIGQVVKIEQSTPMSADKFFKVIEIINPPARSAPEGKVEKRKGFPKS
jgi:small subunit ribosomal protein S17